MYEKSCDGGLRITLALKPEDGSDYRAVAYDLDNKRYTVRGFGSGANDIALRKFAISSTELEFDSIVSVGIEVLTPEGWPAASTEASVRAAEVGVRPPSLPVVGAPYVFDIVGANGNRVSNRDYTDKIIVIDCWATWCRPCMKKMPKLKKLYDRWHEEGLEVIGVNFDQDTARMNQAVEENGLPWRQISAPTDPASRILWWEVSSISTLPRLLVIGRDGVMLLDSNNPAELESLLARLFGGSG